jgi:hypothetical protein
VQKIESWFRDVVDTKCRTGEIYLRDFLAALRKVPELQGILCDVAGVSFTADERRMHARLVTNGLLALTVQERTEVLLAERKRLRDVFGKACGSRSDGMLDWPSFLEFFRSRGFVLE